MCGGTAPHVTSPVVVLTVRMKASIVYKFRRTRRGRSHSSYFWCVRIDRVGIPFSRELRKNIQEQTCSVIII